MSRYKRGWLPKSMRGPLAAIRFADGRTMTVIEHGDVFVTDGRAMYNTLGEKVGKVDSERGNYEEQHLAVMARCKPVIPARRKKAPKDPWYSCSVRDVGPVELNEVYFSAAVALYKGRKLQWSVSPKEMMVELREGDRLLARIMALKPKPVGWGA